MTKFYHRHDHACERPVKGVHGIKGDRGLITELATCHRCGGAGGADQWKRTGWTCYNCGGTGNKGWIDRKVYTAEKIAKLDEAKEKAAAKREAKIKAGRDANIDAFKDEHPDLVAGIAELKDHSHILADFCRTIEQRGSLSERQIAFGLELIVSVREDIARDKAEAEEKARRIDASSHITGEVGDRLVIKGVVLDTFSGPGGFRGNGWTLTKIDTDDGLVVFWGSLHVAGPDDFEVYAGKGDTVELKATIKEFSERDGEKQTTVNRPKIINIELTGEE
jgi:hypothetical protein